MAKFPPQIVDSMFGGVKKELRYLFVVIVFLNIKLQIIGISLKTYRNIVLLMALKTTMIMVYQILLKILIFLFIQI